MEQFTQSPAALLDYKAPWVDQLEDGDTIATSEWFAEGLTITASGKTDTEATVWLEGGDIGRTYRVTNRITTSEGRVDERSFLLTIART